MAFRLLKLGWRAKSKVPTAEYAVMLSAALATVAKPEDLNLDERKRLLAHIERFGSIVPEDPRLTDVHIRAVGYLRGLLKVQDLLSIWQENRRAGKTKEASKNYAEMKRWSETYSEVSEEFAQSRQALKTGYPALFDQLLLPSYFEDRTYTADARDEWESTEFREGVAVPEDAAFPFEGDWSIAVPAHRAEVTVRRYGELLNVALIQAAELADASPDEVDRLRAVAQNVANHTPELPLLQNLESSALSYLSAAMWQASIESMWNAALFGPSDPALRERLVDERDVALRDEWAASEFLRAALQSIYVNARRVFDDLQLDDETLAGLELNDIVEERKADPQSANAALGTIKSAGFEPEAVCSLCGMGNPFGSKFCSECGSRLAYSSA